MLRLSLGCNSEPNGGRGASGISICNPGHLCQSEPTGRTSSAKVAPAAPKDPVVKFSTSTNPNGTSFRRRSFVPLMGLNDSAKELALANELLNRTTPATARENMLPPTSDRSRLG